MRKAYRPPTRSTCPLCHPDKMGHERRWTPRAEEALRRFERERQAILAACGLGARRRHPARSPSDG